MNHNEFKKRNKATLIKSGHEYFDLLLTMIEHANCLIYLHTYILGNDNTGNLIIKHLINAAKRKVQVYILVDGYASKKFSNKSIQSLKNAGINFRFFEPPLQSQFFYFSRRMHQKVVVVDTTYVLVGGLNIADRYNDSPTNKAWLDFAVYIEGEIAEEIEAICKKKWNKNHESTSEYKKEDFFNKGYHCLARPRENDWIWHKNEISNTYIDIFRHSHKEIIILCSYFIPGIAIRRQLKEATTRGVSIKLIVAGKSDIPIAKHAERWLYDWLLRNKIAVYEYQKNILHGKIAVADENFVTIGSYNINNLSTYVSIELNIDIKDEQFAREVIDTLENLEKNDCIKITEETHKKRKNIFLQFYRWLCYQLIKHALKLFTFYYKRKS